MADKKIITEEFGTARVLTDPDHLRILKDEQKITFETVVLGKTVNHQISIVEFDTRDKIEAEMARVLVQVHEELLASGNHKRKPGQDLAPDIQALVDDHKLQ